MSILIKGMNMPDTCVDCPLMAETINVYHKGSLISAEYCTQIGEYADPYNRLNDCPLVEVPPHGRLIDVDKLKDDYFTPAKITSTLNYYYVSKAKIDDAPTIIEAEEGENA